MLDWMKILASSRNYEERLIANNTINNIVIDTCLANDMGKDYETGLLVEGVWYIIEDYDTKEEAKQGHERYMKLIKDKDLKEVIDIYSGNYTKITY